MHLVAADQRGLAELFGGETADEVDKLTQWPWREGPGGVPILEEWNEPEYVSVKCSDPDGYVVEAAWEPHLR